MDEIRDMAWDPEENIFYFTDGATVQSKPLSEIKGNPSMKMLFFNSQPGDITSISFMDGKLYYTCWDPSRVGSKLFSYNIEDRKDEEVQDLDEVQDIDMQLINVGK